MIISVTNTEIKHSRVFKRSKDLTVKIIHTGEKIITVEDLAQEVHQAVSNTQREPLIVTENGRPTAYLISIDLFDTLLAQLEALENSEVIKCFDTKT